jgi:isocitrate dehydrogenase (NAD+)
VLASIKKNKVALKGPTTTPVGAGFRSINVKLRQELNLFANFRPIKSYPGVRSKYENIDLIVVRENIEDLYAGIEFEEASAEARELIKFLETKNFSVRPDSALGVKPISIYRSKAIARFALDYARKNGRKKVTAVHKANIMKYTDGLFLATAKQAAAEYPEIEFEDRIVDNMCMQLVQKPELYDVLVLPNLYGDIISDLCSGLAGGLGTAPGANFGEGLAVFEAIHGSAPKYKGLNKVNPCALILSGVLMLKYIGEDKAADKLEQAVAETIKEGKYVTYDLKPDRDDPTAVGTREMAEEIIRKLRITN